MCVCVRLRDFSEWGQCQVLELLVRYTPSQNEEVYDMLVRDHLSHYHLAFINTQLCLHSNYFVYVYTLIQRIRQLFHVYTCIYMYVYSLSLLFTTQNVLDERLRHANLGVVLGAVRLFLHITEHLPHLHKDVHDRIKGKLPSTK